MGPSWLAIDTCTSGCNNPSRLVEGNVVHDRQVQLQGVLGFASTIVLLNVRLAQDILEVAFVRERRWNAELVRMEY